MRKTLVLSLVLWGCKGSDYVAPDAAPGPDAPQIDATPLPGPVSVTVARQGVKLAGIQVVFHNPDGSKISVKNTDASGTATETVPPSSMVTVALIGGLSPQGTTPVLFTMLGVQPGDDLYVGTPAPMEVAGSANVILTSRAGSTGYYVTTGCQSFGTYLGEPPPTGPTTITVYKDCTTNSGNNYNVLAEALDSTSRPTAFAFATNQPLTAPPSQTMLTSGMWTAPATQQINLNGSASGALSSRFESRLWRGSLQYLSQSQSFAYVANNVQFNVPANSEMDSTVTMAQVNYPMDVNKQTGFSYRLGRSGVAGTTSIHLDDFLPRVHDFMAASTGGVPQVSWTADGSLATADGGLITVSWTADADGGNMFHQWYFVFPGASAGFQAPPLPAELAVFTPSTGANFHVDGALFLRSTLLGSYQAFRRGIFRTNPVNLTPPGSFLTFVTQSQDLR